MLETAAYPVQVPSIPGAGHTIIQSQWSRGGTTMRGTEFRPEWGTPSKTGWDNPPLGPEGGYSPSCTETWLGFSSWTDKETDTCQNITFPRTSYAGGNNFELIYLSSRMQSSEQRKSSEHKIWIPANDFMLDMS